MDTLGKGKHKNSTSPSDEVLPLLRSNELLLDDLSFFVGTTHFANTVSQFQFTAVIALYHAWNY